MTMLQVWFGCSSLSAWHRNLKDLEELGLDTLKAHKPIKNHKLHSHSVHYAHWRRTLKKTQLLLKSWSEAGGGLSPSRSSPVLPFFPGGGDSQLFGPISLNDAGSLIACVVYLLVSCVTSPTAKSISFLVVRMLQYKTWWLKDITLLPGSSSKP